jgi:large subunit ribosomal protein L25
VSEITLQATVRATRGRTAANAVRRSGRVPGIFYLHNEKNIPIEVHSHDLRPLVYTSETHIVDLRFDDGTSEKCILRDVQFDPVTDRVIHFDLMGIVADERIRVEVPIVLKGSAIGVRNGGMLNHLLHKVEVECLPAGLPEHIEVDISHLEIGDMITIGSLEIPDVLFLLEPEVPIVTVGHARGEVAAAPVEEEEKLEPEVILRGKTEEEGKE